MFRKIVCGFTLALFVAGPAHALTTWSFSYTGMPEMWIAPTAGSYYLTVRGASGGGGAFENERQVRYHNGGLGAGLAGTIMLQAGDTATIAVGGVGISSGFEGGGGGGGSGVLFDALSAWIVAGGGGGGGFNSNGRNAMPLSFGGLGGDGVGNPGSGGTFGNLGFGGGGNVNSAGGGGGLFTGASFTGGERCPGGSLGFSHSSGGWGCGGGGVGGGLAGNNRLHNDVPTGGGGGGFSGGGGGATTQGGGGGGTYALGALWSNVITRGYGRGEGIVTITAVPASVPEPGAWLLMCAGFAVTGAALRRGRAFARR